jgi:hypothetical protein
MNVPARLATLAIAAAICVAALPAAASAAKATPLEQAQKLCQRQGGFFTETPAGYTCRAGAVEGFTTKQDAVARKMCLSQGASATFIDPTEFAYYACLVRQPPPFNEACTGFDPPGTFSTTADPFDNTVVWNCTWGAGAISSLSIPYDALLDSCNLVGGGLWGSWSSGGTHVWCDTRVPAS